MFYFIRFYVSPGVTPWMPDTVYRNRRGEVEDFHLQQPRDEKGRASSQLFVSLIVRAPVAGWGRGFEPMCSSQAGSARGNSSPLPVGAVVLNLCAPPRRK